MKTNLREWSTRYQCFIRPKVHFAPEISFKVSWIWKPLTTFAVYKGCTEGALYWQVHKSLRLQSF